MKVHQFTIHLSQQFSMCKNLLINFALILLCVGVCYSQYIENRVVTLPDDVFQIDYSPKQTYLGTATPSMFVLYSGHTGKELQRIAIQSTKKLTSFAFSQDNKWLALGLNDGSVHAYEYNDTTKIFQDSSLVYKGDVESNVTGVCFSSDNNYLVIGILSDQVVVWDLAQDLSVADNFDAEFVLTVSCSPTQNKFAVGGGQNTLTQLVLFELDSTGGNVTVNRLHDFDDPTNSTPYGSTFSADGNTLYSVGKNISITKFDVKTYERATIPVEGLTEQLKKIRVSEDGLVLAVVTNTENNYKIFVVNNTQAIEIHQQALSQKRQLYIDDFETSKTSAIEENVFAVEQIATVIPSVALAPKASSIFYISNTNTGVVGGICPEGEFVNDQNTCEPCSSDCTVCEQGANTCYQCQDARYLSPQNQCLNCIPGCLDCQDGQTCTNCNADAHFILDDTDNTCVCEQSYFKNGTQQCQSCIDGCLQCDNSQTCITCDLVNAFEINDAGVCVCVVGHFKSGNQCLQCIRGCKTCNDQTSCQTCFSQKHYISDDNNSCICDEPEHFVDDGEFCVCEAGYYLVNELGKCQKCRLGCSECTGADVCTTCVAGLHIENDVCVCDDAADYIDVVTETCQPCIDVLDFCQACNSATECTQCQAGIDRHLENGACPCDDGFYPDTAKVCQGCPQLGCSKCTSPDQCLQCDASSHWILNDSLNECQCMEDFVQQNVTCVDCPDGCKVCDALDLSCTECQENWELDGLGGCQCVDGYYELNKTCLQCMAGCLDCLEADTCLDCDEQKQFILDDDTQTCICVSGFFIDIPQRKCVACQSVLPNCQTCQSSSKCTRCSNPFIITPTNQCGCEKGKYVDKTKCSLCQQGCLECTGQQKCTQCDSSHTKQNGICKKQNLDAWVIIIIVVGVLAAAGAVFVLVKCVKKKRLQTSEEYEEL